MPLDPTAAADHAEALAAIATSCDQIDNNSMRGAVSYADQEVIQQHTDEIRLILTNYTAQCT